jgi:dTDP-4-amino-4,6-dideoxygalactose transaminase
LSGAFESRHNHHFESIADDGAHSALPLYNFRIDEMRAALARVEMRTLDERIERLRYNYRFVAERLVDVPGLRLRMPTGPDDCLGDSLNFFVDADRADRIAEAITAEGVLARAIGSKRDRNVRAFWNWNFMSADKEVDAAHMARSVAALSSAIDIPLSPRLERSDLEQVVGAVTKVMRVQRTEQPGAGWSLEVDQ